MLLEANLFSDYFEPIGKLILYVAGFVAIVKFVDAAVKAFKSKIEKDLLVKEKMLKLATDFEENQALLNTIKTETEQHGQIIRTELIKNGKPLTENIYDIKTTLGKLKTGLEESVKTQNDTNTKVSLIDAKQNMMIQLDDAAIFTNDESGNCLSANKTLCKLYGASEEDLLGTGWVSYIHPSDVQGLWDRWSRSIKQNKIITDRYRINIGKRGEYKEFEYTAYVDRVGDKTVITGKVKELC